MLGKATHKSVVFNYVSDGKINKRSIWTCKKIEILQAIKKFRDNRISYKGKHFIYRKLIKNLGENSIELT